MRRRIGILGYDGVQGLDLVGPAEAFASAHAGADPAYDIVIIGLTGRRFRSETGIRFEADTTIARAARVDTLIVPGGRSMRTAGTTGRAAPWIARQVRRTRRIAGVCTGAYALAAAGLLDGRRVTTHWRFAPDLARRYPRLRVEPDQLFIKDGPYYTTAGITAGIDLALALIEEDLGPTQALSVARELVVFLKRPGGQNQFSEPLAFQVEHADRLSDLVTWIAGHLTAPLTVEALAARVCLSPRQFSRVFTETIGVSPAAFVEHARLSEAAERLAHRRVTIEAVARSVGYRSEDVFRRAFERRFGVSPRSYRSRFQAGIRRSG